MDERPADFEMKVYFSRIGYQVDYFVGGEKVNSSCRDYGDRRKWKKSINWFFKHCSRLVEKFHDLPDKRFQ